jgi:hypothetical protein
MMGHMERTLTDQDVDFWASEESKVKLKDGTKAYQRHDTEDRAFAYKKWHRTIGKYCYATDVDLIEWRIKAGVMKPVAITELSRVDNGVFVNSQYLSSVRARWNQRDMQKKTLLYTAAKLCVPIYLVLFREDLSEFWVDNLYSQTHWWHASEEQYTKWLQNL